MNRIKFQVWSHDQQRWRTAYVKPDLLYANYARFHELGYTVRYFP